jgi:hypothetical protein
VVGIVCVSTARPRIDAAAIRYTLGSTAMPFASGMNETV